MLSPRLNRAAPPYTAGLTLIEMMIAMVLLSTVLTMVYGSFFQISTHTRELQNTLKERQVLRMLMRIISDDLAAAQWMEYFWGKGVGNDSGIIANVEHVERDEFTRVNFHAAVPTRFQRQLDSKLDPMVHEVGYYVERDSKKDQLLLYRREDFYLDNDMRDGGLRVRMVGGITNFKVEFLNPAIGENAFGEGEWETSWSSPDKGENSRMPLAIRLTIGRKTDFGAELEETTEFNLPGAYGVEKGGE